MVAKRRRREPEKREEVAVRTRTEDCDVETVGESSTDASSPVSDSSCQTTDTKPAPVPGRTRGPTRRSTKGGWTAEEDEVLARAVKEFGGKNWKKIAEFFQGRSDVQCLHHWQKVLNPELVKGTWTKEEDERMIELVHIYGPRKWSMIARRMPGRIGKQCRERWHNHLNPAIKKGAWTTDEEVTLIKAHQIYGNKWAEISKLLPGRVETRRGRHAIRWHVCRAKEHGRAGFKDGSDFNLAVLSKCLWMFATSDDDLWDGGDQTKVLQQIQVLGCVTGLATQHLSCLEGDPLGCTSSAC